MIINIPAYIRPTTIAHRSPVASVKSCLQPPRIRSLSHEVTRRLLKLATLGPIVGERSIVSKVAKKTLLPISWCCSSADFYSAHEKIGGQSYVGASLSTIDGANQRYCTIDVRGSKLFDVATPLLPLFYLTYIY